MQHYLANAHESAAAYAKDNSLSFDYDGFLDLSNNEVQGYRGR